MKHRSPVREERAAELLAEILDDTEEEARAEQLERQRHVEHSRETRRRIERDERERSLAARQRKLEAELERQRELDRRRTERMRALQGVPPIHAAPPEGAQRPTAPNPPSAIDEPVAPAYEVTALVPPPQQLTKPRSATTTALTAAAALVCALGIVAFERADYALDTTSYAKAVFAPHEHFAVATEVAVVAVPPRPTQASPEAATRSPKLTSRESTSRATPRPSRPSATAAAPSTFERPDQNRHNEAVSRLEQLLESDAFDPFSME